RPFHLWWRFPTEMYARGDQGMVVKGSTRQWSLETKLTVYGDGITIERRRCHGGVVMMMMSHDSDRYSCDGCKMGSYTWVIFIRRGKYIKVGERHEEGRDAFFCNRRLRQAAKNKENNLACGAVKTRAKKGKQAIPVYDVSPSSPVRITRSKARAIEISSEKPRARKVEPTKPNNRKRAEKMLNDGLEPRKQRKRSK
ncbi:hypothetical protein M8C21_031905, partial [Ambrosia artemisiifolia]